MNEYHYLKPHYALLYTPFDILNGVEIKFSRVEINKQAASNRRNENKMAACRVKCE